MKDNLVQMTFMVHKGRGLVSLGHNTDSLMA